MQGKEKVVLIRFGEMQQTNKQKYSRFEKLDQKLHADLPYEVCMIIIPVALIESMANAFTTTL